MRRAVFLDRDGVINPMWLDPDHGLVDSPANPDQFSLLPGATTAIRTLQAHGYLAVVVSNQPGVAKGKLTPELLEGITGKMVDLLAKEDVRLDGIYYCLHHPEAALPGYRLRCECRKPRPGLLTRAAAELTVDLKVSYMVGDGLNDIQAGKSAGCRTVWIGNWKCDVCSFARRQDAMPDLTAVDLRAAAPLLLEDARMKIARVDTVGASMAAGAEIGGTNAKQTGAADAREL